VQLGAGIVVSPKFVPGGKRPVHDSGDPVVGASRLKRDRAFDIAQARYAAGRIILVRSGALRDTNCDGQCETDQTYKLERVFSHNQILS
jgi:hypothetical protein